ncbi:glutathione-dependent formaldehyde-activating enzyme [Hirsutella rhossiliensis]|uniref:Glutathione-dependent formaldehyde-activating enzyme domain-containing protein n=1 Tax=Hirsutella rhossiliensis TaxID=111463 RepID=A0A9P8MWY2_9HYPO|nr:glutathione-dependent formaldehyde-activating enzyme domain-containing protein [Hirsutella rhossiliensis]KAH0962745.1 glutathione-dependent formaldehyde-activating enzyme domain-containing protein [Hirsutella rhossiliensis]
MATKGSCACGDIEFQFPGEPAATALCHCTDCQKWTGGAFTSNAVVPRASFRVTKGTPKAWDAVGGSGKLNRHFFCGRCGSGLYTELEVMPEQTCVKAGALDGGAAGLGGRVDVEFYTKDRVAYLGPCGEGARQEPAFGS